MFLDCQTVVPSGSAAKYGRSFVPTYNLFIPLQNVTAEMGATWICPGTHVCSESDFCSDNGFQASGDENNLPLGYGMLLNQQLTHRGGAHRDPNGPQRVILMLTFAPRPRVFSSFKTVETRKIGLGGSYSQHFSQWGHTLSDFQQPLKYMKQPFRTLRSLGLYNNRVDNHWGWDYVTVCSGSLANHGATCPSVRELKSKLKKAKDASKTMYTLCMAAYLIYLLLSALAPRVRVRHWSTNLVSNLSRIGAIHLLVLSAMWLVRHRITDSTWGRNIHAKRSFRVSNDKFSLLPSVPATLPDDGDILIFVAMQSDSTNSQVRTLEIAHPGNQIWNALLKSFVQGYDNKSVTGQHQICQYVLDIVKQQNRRILTQNHQLNWAVASNEVRQLFCHKRLLQMSNHSLQYLIRSFDGLLSEVRHGYWRNTKLYQKHVVYLLIDLESRIIGTPSPHVPKKKSRRPSTDSISSMVLPKQHNTLHKKIATQFHRLTSKYEGIPRINSPPLTFAGLNVGDAAEAMFGDDDVLGKHLQ